MKITIEGTGDYGVDGVYEFDKVGIVDLRVDIDTRRVGVIVREGGAKHLRVDVLLTSMKTLPQSAEQPTKQGGVESVTRASAEEAFEADCVRTEVPLDPVSLPAQREQDAFWSRYDRGRTSHLELVQHVEALRARNRDLEHEARFASQVLGFRVEHVRGVMTTELAASLTPGMALEDVDLLKLEHVSCRSAGLPKKCDRCGCRLLGHAATFDNCPTCRSDGATS